MLTVAFLETTRNQDIDDFLTKDTFRLSDTLNDTCVQRVCRYIRDFNGLRHVKKGLKEIKTCLMNKL
jgi:hypothetical protein